MDRPLVSVGIPVYNGERYIAQAVESVLGQTLGDWELIVCDNCSTDATPAILERYRDARLRVFRNETNLGMCDNFDRVLSLVRGKYVKLLCADDYLYPNCLAVQAGILEDPANRSVAMTFCRRDVVGPEGRRLFTWGYSGRPGRLRGLDMLRRVVRAGGNVIGEPHCVLFRSELLPAIGGCAGVAPLVLDVDLYSRILANGDAYAVGEPLCAFRVSADSWSVSIVRTQAQDFRNFIAKLAADPKFGLTTSDCLTGSLMCRAKALLKRFFYRSVLR